MWWGVSVMRMMLAAIILQRRVKTTIRPMIDGRVATHNGDVYIIR